MSKSSAEKMRAWRAKNPERAAAIKRKHYEQNKEKLREKARLRARARRAADPEKDRMYNKAWRDANPDKVKAHVLKRDWDLTPEQYEQMLTDQGNKCALCEQPFEVRPVIDHNHRTGKVRGIICCPCNRVLLRGRDTIEYLQKAIDYIKRTDGS